MWIWKSRRRVNNLVIDLELIELKHGSHASSQDGVCLMEAVALFAGEEHTDRPACVCPVLTNFGISLNDRMNTVNRQKLKRLIPRLVGTRNESLENRRAEFLADRALRLFLPIALRHAGDAMEKANLEEHAISLRQCVAQMESLPAGYSATAAAAATAAAREAATATAAAWAAEAWEAARAAMAAAEAARAAMAAAEAWAAEAWEAARAAAAAARAARAEADGVWDIAIEVFEQVIAIGEVAA